MRQAHVRNSVPIRKSDWIAFLRLISVPLYKSTASLLGVSKATLNTVKHRIRTLAFPRAVVAPSGATLFAEGNTNAARRDAPPPARHNRNFRLSARQLGPRLSSESAVSLCSIGSTTQQLPHSYKTSPASASRNCALRLLDAVELIKRLSTRITRYKGAS